MGGRGKRGKEGRRGVLLQWGKGGTSRTEFGQQMRSGELPAYLSLIRLLNGILSYP